MLRDAHRNGYHSIRQFGRMLIGLNHRQLELPGRPAKLTVRRICGGTKQQIKKLIKKDKERDIENQCASNV